MNFYKSVVATVAYRTACTFWVFFCESILHIHIIVLLVYFCGSKTPKKTLYCQISFYSCYFLSAWTCKFHDEVKPEICFFFFFFNMPSSNAVSLEMLLFGRNFYEGSNDSMCNLKIALIKRFGQFPFNLFNFFFKTKMWYMYVSLFVVIWPDWWLHQHSLILKGVFKIGDILLGILTKHD